MPTKRMLEKLISATENTDSSKRLKPVQAALSCLYTAERVRALSLLNDTRERHLAALDLQLYQLMQRLERDHAHVANLSELEGVPIDVLLRGQEKGHLHLTPHHGDIVVVARSNQLKTDMRPEYIFK